MSCSTQPDTPVLEMSCSTQPDTPVLQRPTPCRTPIVLCIDDDPHVAEILQDRLEGYDVRLLRAFFGTQGIWMAATEKPDVIICDLRMPQGDGSTVIECLKRNKQTAAIPIVVLTALHDPKLQHHLEEIGASSYLAKPIRFNDLLDELRRHIEIRRTKGKPRNQGVRTIH
jgi:DNA-binding response OmpR family regulator